MENQMNPIKTYLGLASALAFFACSDSSSSSAAENNPQSTVISVENCQSIDDELLAAQVANANALVLNAFSSRQFESLQSSMDTAKSVFENAIKQYPNSCEAQFGLAVTLLANVVNHPLVDSAYHILYSESENEADRMNFFNVGEGYSNATIQAAALSKSNAKTDLITNRLQNAIASSFLPKTDSAVALLKNVRDAGNFFYTVSNGNDFVRVLDQGDLEMAIGGIQAVNAFLTVLASFNLDVSKDGSHDWIIHHNYASSKSVYLDTLSTEEIASVNHLISLLDKKSPFLTVKSAWKKAYTAIPMTLDSAVENVKSGLQYKIATAGQNPNALYIVGNGEDADISPNDLQKAVDICDSILKGIRGTIQVTVLGENLTINFSKFFSLTDGLQDYLPYFKIDPPQKWLTLPDSGYGWTSDIESDSTNLAFLFILKQLANLSNQVEYDNWYAASKTESFTYLRFYYDSENDWNSVRTTLNQCNYFFGTDYLANTDSSQTFTIPEEFCKVENNMTYYRTLYPYFNHLYFTDKNGNKTVSAHPEELFNKTPEFYAENIIFPDLTFGGIFPEMTQAQLGRFLSFYFN